MLYGCVMQGWVELREADTPPKAHWSTMKQRVVREVPAGVNWESVLNNYSAGNGDLDLAHHLRPATSQVEEKEFRFLSFTSGKVVGTLSFNRLYGLLNKVVYITGNAGEIITIPVECEAKLRKEASFE